MWDISERLHSHDWARQIVNIAIDLFIHYPVHQSNKWSLLQILIDEL